MMNKNSVDEISKRYISRVNQALDRYLPEITGLEKNVCEAMRYSTMAGGKRIRPILTLEFCRVCGGSIEQAIPFACAVEMIHTYSLIHDDLPCMDNDDLRRGKPSCHVKFGEATALLAGDALLSLAFETALCNNDKSPVKPENAVRAAGILATASGASGMVGGQIIDLESEGHSVSLQTLEFMHKKKTGAMIQAAAQMGCVLADASEDKIEAAGNFAQRIGLAFQIVDDILDAIGDDNTIGKPVGSDRDNQKSTYITCFGLEKSHKMAEKLTEEAIEYLQCFGEEKEFLTAIAQNLASRNR